MTTPADPDASVGFRDAVARLAGAQKPAKGSPAYLRWVNRPAGRLLAALAHGLGVTPDAVSAASFATTASALLLVALAPATPALGIAVALLLALGFALDSADGQLARLRGGGSPAGEWLDHVLDAAKHVLLPMAVLVGWWRSGSSDGAWLALPLLAQLVGVLSFSGGLLHDKLRSLPRTVSSPASDPSARAPVRAGAGSTLRAVLMLPADYGMTCMVFLLWGWPAVFRTGWGLLVVAQLVLTAALLVHWRRELVTGARHG